MSPCSWYITTYHIYIYRSLNILICCILFQFCMTTLLPSTHTHTHTHTNSTVPHQGRVLSRKLWSKVLDVYWLIRTGILQSWFNYKISYTSREGNGNPLQYSCLENPTDGGAWWAAVHGVAKSQTRLMWLSSSSIYFISGDCFNFL